MAVAEFLPAAAYRTASIAAGSAAIDWKRSNFMNRSVSHAKLTIIVTTTKSLVSQSAAISSIPRDLPMRPTMLPTDSAQAILKESLWEQIYSACFCIGACGSRRSCS